MASEIITQKPLFSIASELEDACLQMRCCVDLLNQTIDAHKLSDQDKMRATIDNAIFLMRDLAVIHKDFESITQMAYSAARAERAAV